MKLIFTLAVLLTQPPAVDAVPEELERLVGVWSFAAVEVDGQRQPHAPPETNHMIVGPRGAYLVIEGPRITRGQMRIDPTKRPRHLDVDVAGSRSTYKSIYQRRGDELRTCGSYRGGARPERFETTPASGTILHVMRRQEQSVDDALSRVARVELLGRWVREAPPAAAQGRSEPAEFLEFFVDDGDLFVRGANGAVRVVARPLPDPPELDLATPLSRGASDVTRAIYQVDGGVLTIRFGEPGAPRPAGFEEAPTAGQQTSSYRRAPDTSPPSPGGGVTAPLAPRGIRCDRSGVRARTAGETPSGRPSRRRTSIHPAASGSGRRVR